MHLIQSGSGRSPGKEMATTPVFCSGKFQDGGAWQAMVCGIPSRTLLEYGQTRETPGSDSPVILLSPLSLSMALLSSGFCRILCADFCLGFLASDTGSIESFCLFPAPQPTCLTYLLHLVIFWLVTSLYAKTHAYSYYSKHKQLL